MPCPDSNGAGKLHDTLGFFLLVNFCYQEHDVLTFACALGREGAMEEARSRRI